MAIYRVITSADIAKCPKMSMLPAHFTDTGCLCTEKQVYQAELAVLREERARLDEQIAAIREKLRNA